jgi:hypothetical protein
MRHKPESVGLGYFIIAPLLLWAAPSSAQLHCNANWTAAYKCMEHCGPCPNTGQPANNSGTYNNSANTAAADAAAAEKRRQDAEAEQARIAAENERIAEEAAKQAQFDKDKQEALGELKGVSTGESFDTGLKGIGPSDSELKSIPAEPVVPERHYIPAGNGLILGTGAIVYAHRAVGEPAQRMCDAIKQQAHVAHKDYAAGADCSRYNFVLGMAGSLDLFTDLSNRVVFDDLSNGKFSAQEQEFYDTKLRGKQFDELGCHSNGAMLCLAALENSDIKAKDVILYGPLVQDGRVKSVKVFLNENDPVAGASIAYADYKNNPVVTKLGSVDPVTSVAVKTAAATGTAVVDAPLFQVDSLKRTINETSPRLLVQSFPCKLGASPVGCHLLSAYRTTVSCNGKSSGNTVPGTALHGNDALPEPPLPCDALGAKP